MNYVQKDSRLMDGAAGQSLVLVVKGLGHVPSFKNKKRAIKDSRSGKMRTLTEPETAKWMQQCVQSFVSQLIFECPTGGTATSMEDFLRSKIASLPVDDNWKNICDIHLTVSEVSKGDEGAKITLERIN